MTESNISFSAKPLFHPVGDRRAQVVTALRDWYYERFKKHISLLLEQKRSRKVSSSKGRLNPRALHKYRFSDNIFQKHITTNSSDTTIVFLIDGSGSMSSTNSTPAVLKNKIPVEVFVKSAPTTWGPSLTGTENGGMVCLSRVFSSNKRSMDFDRLLRLTTSSPISCEGGNVGSYTSEYAILPALNKWIRKNVKTKKCIVFNLTDGEAYCTLGTDQYQFRSEDTKAMRLKYLRGIPNLTLMLGSYGRGMGRMKDIYGDNMVMAEDDFSGSLFRAFAGFLA